MSCTSGARKKFIITKTTIGNLVLPSQEERTRRHPLVCVCGGGGAVISRHFVWYRSILTHHISPVGNEIVRRVEVVVYLSVQYVYPGLEKRSPPMPHR
jgi:hypothetical protein